jgi:hypothetical protein
MVLGLPAAPGVQSRRHATRGAARRRRPQRARDRSHAHLLPRLHGSCHTIVVDKGYASRELAEAADTLGITIIRPRRRDEPKTPHTLRLSTIRQRIESVFWTMKDLLSLEQHGARTLHNLRGGINHLAPEHPRHSPTTP